MDHCFIWRCFIGACAIWRCFIGACAIWRCFICAMGSAYPPTPNIKLFNRLRASRRAKVFFGMVCGVVGFEVLGKCSKMLMRVCSKIDCSICAQLFKTSCRKSLNIMKNPSQICENRGLKDTNVFKIGKNGRDGQ